MLTSDAELIARIVQDTNRYLDRLQRKRLLWADVENHIAASHIAEYLGDCALVSRHLQTVTYLLMEIHRESLPTGQSLRRRRPIMKKRPIMMKHRRRCPISRAHGR